MGQDAYSLLAYGCMLTESDIKELKKRLGGHGSNDIETILANFFKKFNADNDCQFDYYYCWQEPACLIYAAEPSHFCGNRNFCAKMIANGPTLTLQVGDNEQSVIESLKKELPETAKEWSWQIVITID